MTVNSTARSTPPQSVEDAAVVNRSSQLKGCLAAQLRMLNRVVTGFYEDELREDKVRISQANLLAVILGQGPITPTRLARLLHLDKSTVTRDVSHLRRHGWVEQCRGADDRSYALQITQEGLNIIDRTSAGWERAQEKTRKLIGEEGVALLELLTEKLMSDVEIK